MSTPWTKLPNIFETSPPDDDEELRVGTPIIKSKNEIIIPVCRVNQVLDLECIYRPGQVQQDYAL